MLQTFSQNLFVFFAYSIIGWLLETLYCSIPSRQFVSRGFLKGPYCPIYGIGALLILVVCIPAAGSPLLVFVLAALTATLLEYAASWLLEKLFQIRWWDYSQRKFQLGGRIRLKNSVLFGVLGLVVVYLLQPGISTLLLQIPENRLRILTNTVLSLFLWDLLATVSRLTGFTERLTQLQEELQELREYNEKYDWFDSRNLEESLRRLRELELPELESNALVSRLESALEKRKAGISQLRSYKSARTRTLAEALEAVRDGDRQKSRRHPSVWNKAKALGSRTACAGRGAAKSVVGNLSCYQLFWVFLFAGIMGYLVETLYCLLTTGTIESRQGLLYGPFNQVYGFGAVLMVIFLTPLAGKNDRWIFVGSALLGGAFEALCSWLQETAFGSVSWYYDEASLTVAGGRTSLLFMFFWGVLGLWFVKGIYPKLLAMIQRIPRKKGRALAGVLSIVLVWGMAVSAAAVLRWSQRMGRTAGESRIGAYLDERYPDEFMQTVYPNMLWPDGAGEGQTEQEADPHEASGTIQQLA